MRVRVLVFGIVKEIVGESQLYIDLDGEVTAALVKEKLLILYPGLSGVATLAIAINGNYADPSTIIRLHDEIAMIPPVSGG